MKAIPTVSYDEHEDTSIFVDIETVDASFCDSSGNDQSSSKAKTQDECVSNAEETDLGTMSLIKISCPRTIPAQRAQKEASSEQVDSQGWQVGRVLGTNGSSRPVVLLEEKVRMELKSKMDKIAVLEEEVRQQKERISSQDEQILALHEDNLQLQLQLKHALREILRLKEQLSETIPVSPNVTERVCTPIAENSDLMPCVPTEESRQPSSQVHSRLEEQEQNSLSEPSKKASITECPGSAEGIYIGNNKNASVKVEPIVCDKRVTVSEKPAVDSDMSSQVNPIKPQDHAVDESRGGMWYCICGSRYKGKSLLSNHIRWFNIVRLKSFVCYKCGERYETVSRLSLHLKNTHKIIWNGKNGCRNCGNTFETRKQLLHHMRDIHSNGPLVRGDRKPEKTEPVPSSEVGIPVFRNFSEMEAIKITPEDTLISEKVATMAVLSVMRNLSTKQKPQEQLEATAVVGDEGEGESTEKTVDAEVPQHGVMGMMGSSTWLCLCGQGFTREDTLNNHVALKLFTNPIFCDVCKMPFPRKDYLRQHVIREHGADDDDLEFEMMMEQGPLHKKKRV